ncbi:MAG: DUF368 domain-containing protein [Halomonas sp.]|nr:DUF368 domain-containing protein [Halomonas sp.]
MKRYPGIFLRGAGMGAADAVPGVSGGTIAFVTGIYEELIHTIKQFGPSAFTAWRQGGVPMLVAHLNLGFIIPLMAGIAASLITVAHLVVWLMDDYPLLLNGFFFGLVAASALVVGRHPSDWKWWHLLPLVAGLLLIAVFGVGCLIGLFFFSRLLSWLLRRHHAATLQLLVGFIVGSLPVLWPWRELVRYQLGPEGQMIPLDYRYLTPGDFAVLTGESAQLLAVAALMLVGLALVLLLDRTGGRPATASTPKGANKEDASDA